MVRVSYQARDSSPVRACRDALCRSKFVDEHSCFMLSIQIRLTVSEQQTSYYTVYGLLYERQSYAHMLEHQTNQTTLNYCRFWQALADVQSREVVHRFLLDVGDRMHAAEVVVDACKLLLELLDLQSAKTSQV